VAGRFGGEQVRDAVDGNESAGGSARRIKAEQRKNSINV